MFVIELINLQILDFEIDFENDIFFLNYDHNSESNLRLKFCFLDFD